MSWYVQKGSFNFVARGLVLAQKIEKQEKCMGWGRDTTGQVGVGQQGVHGTGF